MAKAKLGNTAYKALLAKGLTTFYDYEFDDVEFDSSTPQGLTFQRCNFIECEFTNADLTGTVFDNCEIVKCQFLDCTLEQIRVSECTGRDTLLAACDFSNSVWTNCLFKDFAIHQSTGTSASWEDVDFEESSFIKSKWLASVLLGVEFTRCEFEDCHFNETKLDTVQFERCTSHRSEFPKAELKYAWFNVGVLKEANFFGAELWYVSFVGLDMTECDFEIATITSSNFLNCNLTDSKNLGTATTKGTIKVDQSTLTGTDWATNPPPELQSGGVQYKGSIGYVMYPIDMLRADVPAGSGVSEREAEPSDEELMGEFIEAGLRGDPLERPVEEERLARITGRGTTDIFAGMREGTGTLVKRNPVQQLIKRCQRLWEAYDAKPTKKNLMAFGKCIGAMKVSKSARVKQERRRALRAFRKEMRDTGWVMPKKDPTQG